MIKIVMDSGGDLPAAWLAQYDVSVVPINIHFGTQVYQEGVDMDAATFYRRVDEENRIPTNGPAITAPVCRGLPPDCARYQGRRTLFR